MNGIRTLKVNGEYIEKDLDKVEIVFGPHHRVSIFEDENGDLVNESITIIERVRRIPCKQMSQKLWLS